MGWNHQTVFPWESYCFPRKKTKNWRIVWPTGSWLWLSCMGPSCCLPRTVPPAWNEPPLRVRFGYVFLRTCLGDARAWHLILDWFKKYMFFHSRPSGHLNIFKEHQIPCIRFPRRTATPKCKTDTGMLKPVFFQSVIEPIPIILCAIGKLHGLLSHKKAWSDLHL